MDQVIVELKKVKEKTGKIPTADAKGMSRIYQLVQRGEYSQFNIKNWTELLLFVYGEANVKPSRYDEEDGLDVAIKVIKEYKRTHGKNPTMKSEGMSEIINAIERGNWKESKILKWNDILFRAVGETNKERNKYAGKEDLDRALKELLDYKVKYGKEPASNTLGFVAIYMTLRRGEWEKSGVTSWKVLKEIAFGSKENGNHV